MVGRHIRHLIIFLQKKKKRKKKRKKEKEVVLKSIKKFMIHSRQDKDFTVNKNHDMSTGFGENEKFPSLLNILQFQFRQRHCKTVITFTQ